MKKCVFLFAMACMSVFFAACDSAVTTPGGDSNNPYVPVGGSGPIQLRAALQSQASRDNAFALKLFRKMASGINDSNCVVSPLSVSIALGMAWNGATDETKAEMASLLELSSSPDSVVNAYYEVMQKSLPVVDSSTTVNLANSLWYTQTFTVKPTFLTLNKHFFDAEIRRIDFKKAWAKDTINAWVDAKTNHLIPTIVQNTADQVLFLINAVYFKGAWTKPFSSKQTFPSTFFKQSGTTEPVNLMYLCDTLRYTETATAQWLDLPYGNGAYSMTLVLPKAGLSTSNVLETLTPNTWDAAIASMETTRVGIYIPRFKVECSFNLVPTLRSLGMKKAFTDLAEFSGISDEPVLISEVKHKTYVEVTEDGTTAAAVTSIGFATTSLPSYPIFSANKPFLFFIRENGSKVILFAGKMADVTKF